MASAAAVLTERYRDALRLGEQLLALLRSPLSPEAMDEVERLIEARDEALRATDGLVRPGIIEESAREVLERLVAQQRALEQEMARAMAEMRQSTLALRETRQNVQAVRRVLSPGPRSRRLDQRR